MGMEYFNGPNPYSSWAPDTTPVNSPPSSNSGGSSDLGIGWFSLAQGFGAIASAYEQGTSQKLQYDYQAQVTRENAALSEIQAEDAIRRGSKEADKIKAQTKQVIGAQRAGYAAQNVSVDEGVAADIQAETAAIGAENAMTVKNNAWREAWGYRVQASQGRSSANFSRMAGNNVMGNTLLTGGLQAINYGANAYYMSNRKTPTRTGE